MKKQHVFALGVTVFLCLLSTQAIAGLFSPMWEWDHPKLVGKVKEIEERSANVTHKIAYDAQGRRTEAQRLDQYGRIVSRYFFTYDKDGNLILIECFTGNNPNPLRETIYYAEKGIIKLIDSFESPRRAEFVYDDKKRIKDVVVMGAQGLTKAKWTFLYDAQGRFAGETYTDLDGNYAGKRVFVYNAEGFLAEQTTYNAQNQVTGKRTYTYEYDKQGNWVKKTVVWLDYPKPGQKPNEAKSVVTRKIKYY